jgi:hypothetical protein
VPASHAHPDDHRRPAKSRLHQVHLVILCFIFQSLACCLS